MPGTGLSRQQNRGVPAVLRVIARLPGVSSPATSGPALASVLLDDRWSGLRDEAFVVVDRETDVRPVAQDRQREARLWQATSTLLADAG